MYIVWDAKTSLYVHMMDVNFRKSWVGLIEYFWMHLAVERVLLARIQV